MPSPMTCPGSAGAHGPRPRVRKSSRSPAAWPPCRGGPGACRCRRTRPYAGGASSQARAGFTAAASSGSSTGLSLRDPDREAVSMFGIPGGHGLAGKVRVELNWGSPLMNGITVSHGLAGNGSGRVALGESPDERYCRGSWSGWERSMCVALGWRGRPMICGTLRAFSRPRSGERTPSLQPSSRFRSIA